MFHHLAAALNTRATFKWFPMFDQVQTLSSNILHYKQMFDHLANLCHTKLARAGKSNQSQAVFPAWDCVDLTWTTCHVIISAVIHTKRSAGSCCSISDQRWFARLATEQFA